MIWALQQLIEHVRATQTCIDGKWVAARPLKDDRLGQRFRAVWEVWRGRAEAFTWPEEQ